MVKKNDIPSTIWDAVNPTLKILYIQELELELPPIMIRYTIDVITVNLDNTPKL